MKVIGTRRSEEAVANVDVVFPPSQLLKHLPKADYIVVAAPLTAETEGLLGGTEFGAMKETAYYINVGRGKIANEESLIEVLKASKIGGAYLDCFAIEPLPSDSPFWEMENVFIVPHDSHSSPKIGNRLVDQFCTNLSRYIAEKPLFNICDPRKGY